MPLPICALFVLTMFFALIPSAMPLGYSRFRTHAAPLLCIMASVGIARLFYKRNAPAPAGIHAPAGGLQ